MDKYNRPVFRQHNVRPSLQSFSVQAELVPHPVQDGTDEFFRPGIFPFDPAHVSATARNAQAIRHAKIIVTPRRYGKL